MWRIAASLLASVGTILMFAASVPPDEATSNWAKWLGIAEDPPTWLTAERAEKWAFGIGLGLVVAAVLIWRAFRQRGRTVSDSANPKVPTDIAPTEKTNQVSSNEHPLISIEVASTHLEVGDFVSACVVRCVNNGPTLDGKCLVQLENPVGIGSAPNPLVLKTEGQWRGKRTGRFTLSRGQFKNVPVLWRRRTRRNELFFIGEDKQRYLFSVQVGKSAEMDLAFYGADELLRTHMRITVGENWSVAVDIIPLRQGVRRSRGEGYMSCEGK